MLPNAGHNIINNEHVRVSSARRQWTSAHRHWKSSRGHRRFGDRHMTRPPGPPYTPHPITASHELSSVQPVHSLDWDNT